MLFLKNCPRGAQAESPSRKPPRRHNAPSHDARLEEKTNLCREVHTHICHRYEGGIAAKIRLARCSDLLRGLHSYGTGRADLECELSLRLNHRVGTRRRRAVN